MNNDHPLVSILIPCYNSADYVADTLRSCLAQDYDNIEIIVVDDGSADDSFSIAKSFESAKCKVVRQENAGACRARNYAFELSQGEYVKFLDADDLLFFNTVSVQMNALQRIEDPRAVAYCALQRFLKFPGDLPFHSYNYQSWERGLDFELGLLNGSQPMCGLHCYLTPRRIIAEAGPWEERLRLNQDGEFFARVLLNCGKLLYCPETVVYYRRGIATSISSQRSVEKQASALLAAQKIRDVFLAKEDSLRVRQALSAALVSVAYSSNLLVPEIAEKALKEIEALGEKPHLNAPFKARIVSYCIGAHNFLRLQRFVKA